MPVGGGNGGGGESATPGGFGGGEGWTAEPVAVAVMAIFWPASQCRDHAHRK